MQLHETKVTLRLAIQVGPVDVHYDAGAVRKFWKTSAVKAKDRFFPSFAIALVRKRRVAGKTDRTEFRLFEEKDLKHEPHAGQRERVRLMAREEHGPAGPAFTEPIELKVTMLKEPPEQGTHPGHGMDSMMIIL